MNYFSVKGTVPLVSQEYNVVLLERRYFIVKCRSFESTKSPEEIVCDLPGGSRMQLAFVHDTCKVDKSSD